MQWPKVGIVLINFNGLDDTFECVESLSKITYPDYQVYVVDNGSKINPREKILGAFPQFKIIENGANLGFTGGNNAGCRAALGDGLDYVFLLNNDTAVDPDFLQPLVEAMMKDPGLGMVTPKIYFYGQEKVFWAYGGKVDRLTGRSPHIGVYKKDEGQYDHIHEVERITGCAMLVRREVFERVGSMDDKFFIYCEETDWCLRTRRAGYRLAVIPKSIIWHKGHRDSGRVGRPFIGYLLTRNHLLYIRKNSNYFVAGGAFAILWYFLSVSTHLGRFYFRWLARRDPRDREYAEAVLSGAVNFWRGKWGPPPWLKGTTPPEPQK